MGSPMSPILVNFIKKFKEEAIKSRTHKPSVWLWYIDDTFVIWNHEDKELNIFLRHLNSLHSNIEFTMEIEADSSLPFLDVLVTWKENQKLGHTVFRKHTHTDRYLHKNSNHHPRQKTGIIKTTQEPSPLKMPATDAGETSGRRSISRPRSLSPKGKHSNISADRESLNQYIIKSLLPIYEAPLFL